MHAKKKSRIEPPKPQGEVKAVVPISSSSSITPAAVDAFPVSSGAAPLSRALLIVGTYHSIMAGLVLRGEKFMLKFSVKHHVGCVNCVAVTDKYIATAGTDERLFLFTCKDNATHVANLGSVAPASEVTSLAFPNAQFLVCGCVDGTLSIYRSRDWESVLAVRIHDKPIQCLALHPLNGIICATASTDRHIALVDMSTGKLITKTKLSVETGVPHTIVFNAAGSHFAVATAYSVVFFDTMTMTEQGRCVTLEKQPPFEIHTVAFISNSEVCCGLENGSIVTGRFVPIAIVEDVPTNTSVVADASTDKRRGSKLTVEAISMLEKKSKRGETSNNKPDKRPREEVPVSSATNPAASPPIIATLTPITIKLPAASSAVKPPQGSAPLVRVRTHTARVKVLQVSSGTMISADTEGIVIAWDIVLQPASPSLAAGCAGSELLYRCSANCGGRITSVAILPQ